MKRILIVALALMLVLAGCTVQVPAAAPAAPAAAPVAAAEVSTAPGTLPVVPGDPIKIGYSMPSATHGYMARAIYWPKRAWPTGKPRIPPSSSSL